MGVSKIACGCHVTIAPFGVLVDPLVAEFTKVHAVAFGTEEIVVG
jgi:hypothetical protein